MMNHRKGHYLKRFSEDVDRSQHVYVIQSNGGPDGVKTGSSPISSMHSTIVCEPRSHTVRFNKSGSSDAVPSLNLDEESNDSDVNKRTYYWRLFLEHRHTTVTLCFVFMAFGMCIAFLGPTLLDLGCKTETAFATMSTVFFCQSFFILLGSVCAGVMLHKFNREILLFISIFMMAAAMASIPMCNALLALSLVLAVMGFFMGTIDTVANVSMITIYGKDVSPFLQTIHFFYGVGAFVSPMIVQPFLLNEDCSPFILNDSEPVFPANHTFLPADTLEEAQQMTHIDKAFLIMALIMVPVVMLAFSLLAKKRCLQWLGGASFNLDHKENLEYDNMGDQHFVGQYKEDPKSTKSMMKITLVTVLAAVLLFLYDGLQASFGGYIYSYAVKGPVRYKKSDAAFLNALFWGMFATGRLISIALATKLSPSIMLFINIMGCTSSLILMLALRYNHIMLIAGTCMIGIFMSSVFPTTLSLTEQYIHITPYTTSLLVFGAAVGEMSIPVLVGHEFDSIGPISFLVTCLALCFTSIIFYMTLWLVGLTLIKPDSKPGIMIFFTKYMPETVEKIDGENTNLVNQNIQNYSRMSRTESVESAVVNIVKRDSNSSH